METLNFYKPHISTKLIFLAGIIILTALALLLLEFFKIGSSDAIVILYFTGHLSFQQAQIALEALGVPTATTIAILTSSSVAAAIGTGALDAVIERILISFLGFWDGLFSLLKLAQLPRYHYEI